MGLSEKHLENVMKIKTAEATPLQLDWLVAKAQKFSICVIRGVCHDAELVDMWTDGDTTYSPSTNWAQGGPIIEREEIGLFFYRAYGNRWRANHPTAPYMLAETPLIAAMRCYVASKLGDEVEVPDQLT